jgi:hypothetical protein
MMDNFLGTGGTLQIIHSHRADTDNGKLDEMRDRARAIFLW